MKTVGCLMEEVLRLDREVTIIAGGTSGEELSRRMTIWTEHRV